MRLYDLSAEATRLVDIIQHAADNPDEEYVDPETGEVITIDEAMAALSEANNKGEEYLDSMTRAVDTIRAEAKALVDEGKRLKDRGAKRNDSVYRLKSAMLDYMKARGLKKVVLPTKTLSRTAGRVSVSIDDMDKIPDALKTEKVTVTVDKNAIAAAFKDGHGVPGASPKTGDDILRIL